MIHNTKIFMGFTLVSFLAFSLLPWAPKALANGYGKWEGIPAITLKLPGQKTPPSQTTPGKNAPGKEKRPWSYELKTMTLRIEDFEKYHGGIGPGNALGFRACQIALTHLYPGEIPPRKDQFVILGSEKDCPADAVTYVTGARYGKGALKAFNGNLAFDQSLGAFNFIFASMGTGKAVKLLNRFEWPQEFIEFYKKGNPLTPEEQMQSEHLTRSLSRYILTAPENEIFEVIPLAGFDWKTFKENYLK